MQLIFIFIFNFKSNNYFNNTNIRIKHFYPILGKKPFFNWISADSNIATARGGGGGLALWQRDVEMQGKNKALAAVLGE